MIDPVFCLDTSVWIKYLTMEEPASDWIKIAKLVTDAISRGQLIAPSFAWAEVGSVLRKKVRQGLLGDSDAQSYWFQFGNIPIVYDEGPPLRAKTWDIAQQYGLPTLYDAAFLACAEAWLPATTVEFWTADQALLRQLASNPPSYLRSLGDA